jgi:hypothetical protein
LFINVGTHLLDNDHVRGKEAGVIHFIVIPSLSATQKEPIVVMGKYRHGWILLPVDPETQHHSKETKAQCGDQEASGVIRAVDRLLSAGQPPAGDLDSFLSLKYKITFSMLVSAAVGGPVNWEIDTALLRFVDPFVEKLGVLADFVIDSQVLYASRLSDPEAEASLQNVKDFEVSVVVRLVSFVAGLLPLPTTQSGFERLIFTEFDRRRIRMRKRLDRS